MPYKDKELQEIIQANYKKNGYIDIVEIAIHFNIVVIGSSLEDSQNSFIRYNQEKKRYEIYVEKSHHPNRQRFSIAHEVAHFLLHKEDINLHEKVARNHNDSLDSKKEREADYMAAQLLMPENILKELVNTLKVVDENAIEFLSKKFLVSKSTMIIRLNEIDFYVPLSMGM
jgi:Zn-dependent peptidase ImmA (M78 family)